MSLAHPHAVGGATRRPIGRRARSTRVRIGPEDAGTPRIARSRSSARRSSLRWWPRAPGRERGGQMSPTTRETVRGEAIRAAILVVLSFLAIDLVLPAVLEAARSSTLP